eukprot:365386-Chlamydomonas_euryale.AAC.10
MGGWKGGWMGGCEYEHVGGWMSGRGHGDESNKEWMHSFKVKQAEEITPGSRHRQADACCSNGLHMHGR